MTSTDERNVQQERAMDILKDYVEGDWKIFMDTCSLLHFAADKFWYNIIPILQQNNKRIIIPAKCVEELEKHSENTEKPELAKDALYCRKLLTRLIEADVVELRGEKCDTFPDNVFKWVFEKFRMIHNLLLITQDNKLAKDILSIKNSESVIVREKDIQVRRINQYGFLSKFYWNEDKEPDTHNGNYCGNKCSEADQLDASEVFRICTKVTAIGEERNYVSYVPGANEVVYTSHGQIRLCSEIGSGGEGIIYETDTPYVAKIYKKEKNDKLKYEKIKLMLSKKIECEGVCYPVDLLYNSRKEFVGYLMPKAKGKELQRSIFIKQLFMKNFPNWKKRDTVELCVTILEKIKYLHDRNIIMGDINPLNILVVSPTEVYFVDTDSYQVEEFPCPVGTINFTAPEIQGEKFREFLRTRGNENFAVATLLFMIMLPGKPPYSQQGGADPASNIKSMDFSYPFGDNSNKKTPDGPWRFMWSHLTYDLKEAFYNTFRKGEPNATEETRLNVNEWLKIFNYYLYLLDAGKLAGQDPMSVELYPTRHKRNPNVTYINCKLCGKEIAEDRSQEGICGDCLNEGEVYNCERCGKEIVFTNYHKYVKKAKRYNLCHDCFEYGNQVRMRQVCIDCGQTFDITNNEYEFFESKGYEIPKRCKACRDERKNRSYAGCYSQSSDRYHGSSSHQSSNGGLFDFFGKLWD